MNNQELGKKLSKFKEIMPSRELADKIISDYKEPVKGRLLFNELIFNQIHKFMTDWKVVASVAVAILIFAFLGVFNFSGQKPVSVSETDWSIPTSPIEYIQTPQEVFVPEATGEIDNLIDAMTAFAENEQTITLEEGNDASMVTLDSQAISDFGQSYNENEF